MSKKRNIKVTKKSRKSFKKNYSTSSMRYQGTLEVKKSGHGLVTTRELDKAIFIPRKYINNAFGGDKVEVTLLKTPLYYEVEGKISRIIERDKHFFIGELFTKNNQFFVKCENGIIVNIKENHNLVQIPLNYLVVTEVTNWKKKKTIGKIIEVLGDKASPHISLKKIARKYGFFETFSSSILEKISTFSEEFINSQSIGRIDLRNIETFTVDPATAKDFDDAISIKINKKNNFELIVHIADVAAFIPQQEELDIEACNRGNSLYMPSSVIPMLPFQLSNNLCSLKPKKDRLAMSCIMEIDTKGEIINYAFKESIINSDMRFSYEIFQDLIESESKNKEISPQYKPFIKTAKIAQNLKDILKNKRIKKGSIDFNIPEIEIELDKEGIPINIHHKANLEACNIIEEFMLAANLSAADMIAKSEKIPGVYRTHEKPSKDKLFQYLSSLENYDIDIEIPEEFTNHKFIQDVIKKIKTIPNSDILTQNFLRSMMKAKYTTRNIGHYGLAFDLYTHFTSPIRRYADLMVHRIIKKIIHKLPIKKAYDKKSNYEKICRHISMREIEAIKAEYEAKDTKIIEFMSDKVGNIYQGKVVSITSFGAYVLLDEIPVEGMLPIRNLKDDKYIYDKEKNIIEGKNTKKILTLGTEVEIIVEKIDREMLNIDFNFPKK